VHEALKDQFSFPGKLIGKDGKTLQKIADMDGTVSHMTVKRAIEDSVLTNVKTPPTVIGKDGKTYPTTKPRKKRLNMYAIPYKKRNYPQLIVMT